MTTCQVAIASTDGTSSDVVIEEVPVALVYNGISHVVMMASPADLEDFALGFSLTEGIIQSRDEWFSADVQHGESGIEVQCHIHGEALHRLKERRRQLAGRTGCGLCGVESLEEAIRPLSPVHGYDVRDSAISNVVRAMDRSQPIAAATGAAHVAAWCAEDGTPLLAREDVGRHVALDKLIGAWREPFDNGFVFVSSRASYEMVHKAASVGIGALVAASAPTSLAIDWAKNTGLQLIGFARSDRHVRYTP